MILFTFAAFSGKSFTSNEVCVKVWSKVCEWGPSTPRIANADWMLRSVIAESAGMFREISDCAMVVRSASCSKMINLWQAKKEYKVTSWDGFEKVKNWLEIRQSSGKTLACAEGYISSMVLVNQSLNFRIRYYGNENGSEAEMRPAIITRYASVSYWPIFSSSLITVSEVFTKIISPQFFSRF